MAKKTDSRLTCTLNNYILLKNQTVNLQGTSRMSHTLQCLRIIITFIDKLNPELLDKMFTNRKSTGDLNLAILREDIKNYFYTIMKESNGEIYLKLMAPDDTVADELMPESVVNQLLVDCENVIVNMMEDHENATENGQHPLCDICSANEKLQRSIRIFCKKKPSKARFPIQDRFGGVRTAPSLDNKTSAVTVKREEHKSEKDKSEKGMSKKEESEQEELDDSGQENEEDDFELAESEPTPEGRKEDATVTERPVKVNGTAVEGGSKPKEEMSGNAYKSPHQKETEKRYNTMNDFWRKNKTRILKDRQDRSDAEALNYILMYEDKHENNMKYFMFHDEQQARWWAYKNKNLIRDSFIQIRKITVGIETMVKDLNILKFEVLHPETNEVLLEQQGTLDMCSDIASFPFEASIAKKLINSATKIDDDTVPTVYAKLRINGIPLDKIHEIELERDRTWRAIGIPQMRDLGQAEVEKIKRKMMKKIYCH